MCCYVCDAMRSTCAVGGALTQSVAAADADHQRADTKCTRLVLCAYIDVCACDARACVCS
jgi:hypothetical protein